MGYFKAVFPIAALAPFVVLGGFGAGFAGAEPPGTGIGAVEDFTPQPAGVAPYERAGWVARFGPGLHAAEGVATIIDATTIQIDHFTYDGTAPAVYFYLGAENTQQAFANGLQVPPLLSRAYNDESLTLTLPDEETMDGYHAISVWCAAVSVNFASATFVPPWGDMNCDGAVNAGDIDPFVLALTDPAAYPVMFPDCDIDYADINGDGAINAADIDPFVNLLTGG